MGSQNVCLIGGSGFVGSRIAAQLAEGGRRVRVLTRHRDRHRELLVLPTVEVIEGDVHDAAFLRGQFAGMDAVINLVGILNERGRSGRGFARAHVELPRKIIEACRASNVRRLLHMSALNASTEGPSRYLRSKGEGEALARAAHGPELAVTIFRPSVIFGRQDSFTNRFAALLRLVPGVFPLACPNARMQPVHVEDVARAFVLALDDHHTFGQRYNLCGPKVYRLRELVEYVATLTGVRPCVVGLNDFASKLQAAVMELVPGKPFSLDNYRSLTLDAVCTEPFPAVFGIQPAALEEIAPRYLGAPRA